MIYTTGGMSLARVSVVDGAGTEVYDEFVRLDEGVEVMSAPPHTLVAGAALTSATETSTRASPASG
jgi:hypothetical protein